MKPYLGISPFVHRFVDKREIARRAKTRGQLWEYTIPSVFVAWAQRMGFELPQELVEEITARGIQIADWKTNYDQQKAIAETARQEADDERKARLHDMRERKKYLDELMEQQRRTTQSFHDLLKTKDEHIASLSDEVERLSRQAAAQEEPSSATGDEKPIGTRERESMEKLIVGMAIRGYGFAPVAARSLYRIR